MQGYGTATMPPLIELNGVGEYYCIDTIIKAHATAFHLYKNKYYTKFNGKIGITLNSRFFFSMVNDTDLVDYGMQFWVYKYTIYRHYTTNYYLILDNLYVYSWDGWQIRYTAKQADTRRK